MSKDELLARISVDPTVCFGKPCIQGHRIWVSLILDLLAAGWSHREVLANYPGIEDAEILACIAYGAEMSRERYIDIAVAHSALKLKLVFRPSDDAGIAVLRLPHRAMDTNLWAACEVLVRGLRIAPLAGRLWIVHRGIIREYRPEQHAP